MCDFMVSVINSERHSNYVYNELNEFPRYNKPTSHLVYATRGKCYNIKNFASFIA